MQQAFSLLLNGLGTLVSTDPGVSNVLDGVTYQIESVAKEGTLDIVGSAVFPDEDEVLTGIVFGPTGDDYTGDVVLPAVSVVKDGEHFGSLSLLEGTYDPMAAAVFPSAANVWHGTAAYGPTGAEYTPSKVGSSITNLTAGNVKLNVVVDDVTGTYAVSSGTATYPTAAQVLTTIAFGPTGTEYTGTVVLPAAASVLSTVSYGPASGTTGTYVAVSTHDVEYDVSFGPASAYKGRFVSPSVGDVRTGVLYGYSGEFVGMGSTLTPDPGDPMTAPKSALYSFLTGDTEIAASVGTRVYEGMSARGSAFPKITFHRLSGSPIDSMMGATGLARLTWQINCWSNVSNLAADAVARLVYNRLHGYHGEMGDGHCSGCWMVDSPDRLIPPEDASSEAVHCVSTAYEMFYAEVVPTG
jgi:hypothetical protein